MNLYGQLQRQSSNIILGIKKAFQKYKQIKSLSIDSWGVDYVLMNGDKPIKPFYAYRDARTKKPIEEVHKIISFKDLYKITGMQFAEFNSIYQLRDDFNKGRLDKATDFLHIPEYFSYLLTGKKIKEYTMASTTGMIDLKTKQFSKEIISKLGYKKSLFPNVVQPGFILGKLKPEIAKKVGGNLNVIMCASHDTGSAYEAIEVDAKTIILSSGTWSLFGVKISKGNNKEVSLKHNFTNEGGVNYIRYLKNIMGMWILNEVKKHHTYSFNEINELVEKSKYKYIFDVNDNNLLAPSNMIKAIRKLLKKNPPKTDGDLYRSIYYSLATCYKNTCLEIEKCLNKKSVHSNRNGRIIILIHLPYAFMESNASTLDTIYSALNIANQYDDDGKTVLQKLEECKEVFDLFDKNKDGSISTNELGEIMKALGANPTKEELQQMLNEVDTDGSGKIEFKEFLDLFTKRMKEPDTENDLIEAFKIFDKDGNGTISVKELKNVMSTLGESLSDEECEEIIKEADIDGDGCINYHEFVKIMMSK
mgnify:CR=1 FL=1